MPVSVPVFNRRIDGNGVVPLGRRIGSGSSGVGDLLRAEDDRTGHRAAVIVAETRAWHRQLAQDVKATDSHRGDGGSLTGAVWSNMTHWLSRAADVVRPVLDATLFTSAAKPVSGSGRDTKICSKINTARIRKAIDGPFKDIKRLEIKYRCKLPKKVKKSILNITWCNEDVAAWIGTSQARENLPMQHFENIVRCKVGSNVYEEYSARFKLPQPPEKTTSLNGRPDCPCLDTGVGRSARAMVDGKVIPYDKDVGSQCRTWEDGIWPGCGQGETPGLGKEWCIDTWCYVDPCRCEVSDWKQSLAFNNFTYMGQGLYWSYGACGSSAVSWASSGEKRCESWETEDHCHVRGGLTSDNITKCLWTDNSCYDRRTAEQCLDETDDDSAVDPDARVPTKTGKFNHNDKSLMCHGCGNVFYDYGGDSVWAIVMKLVGNQFCWNSSAWNSETSLNSEDCENKKIVKKDCKSNAFHKLQGVNALKFENYARKTVTVEFINSNTPQNLILTDQTSFAREPLWKDWKKVFAPDVSNDDEWDHAPIFMRGGVPVQHPAPNCRSGDLSTEGCSEPCTFCFVAGKGNGCPASGNKTDDVTYGLGINQQSCFVSREVCSAGGSGRSIQRSPSPNIIVWAQVPKAQLEIFAETPFNEAFLESLSTMREKTNEVIPYIPQPSRKKMIDGNDDADIIDDLSTIEEDDEESEPSDNGIHEHEPGDLLCNDCGKVLYKKLGQDSLALVLKLSKNEFCYDSDRWTDGLAYNPELMLNDSMPGIEEYDAKSLAFHRLKGVDALIISNAMGSSTTVEFELSNTPEHLMTRNAVAFKRYPAWASWNTVFVSSRNFAPMFVRAGLPVLSPDPPCRTGGTRINGCGQKCMFCFVVSKGSSCPALGQGDDLSVGIGSSSHGCGNNPSGCSSSTHTSLGTQLMVWARVSHQWEMKTKKPKNDN
eukprot:TRINITY_DN69263_c0_g1_i1.p1 TRINITY_DN69263_c0_g1~~TRINITY_DN69263_c0_g1_i1.p1  ORF type:complete len:1010 (+),score=136.78 TRINITY_DN69263_c0_g1_i1:225-3032(+)